MPDSESHTASLNFRAGRNLELKASFRQNSAVLHLQRWKIMKDWLLCLVPLCKNTQGFGDSFEKQLKNKEKAQLLITMSNL